MIPRQKIWKSLRIGTILKIDEDKEKQYEDYFSKLCDDPALFLTECIGITYCDCGCKLDPKIMEIFGDARDMILAREKKARGEELDTYEKKLVGLLGISIKACKGAGKTAFLAQFYIWMLTLFPDTQKHLVTAPTQNHLKDNLFGEISKWISHSKKYARIPIVDMRLELQGLKLFRKNIRHKDGTLNKSAVGKECILVGRTASKSADAATKKSTLHGYHDVYLIPSADECFGVDNDVYEPVIGTLTKEVNFIILIGNPTRNSGFAFDTFHDNRHLWINHTISLDNTTIVTEEYTKRMKEIYQDYPNQYRVFVLGEFPLDDDNSLIPYNKIMDAVDRYSDIDFEHPLVKDRSRFFGGDVGCGGDLTVLFQRQGMKADLVGTLNERDTLVTARWIGGHVDLRDPHKIGIDGIAWGKGTYDMLKELGYSNVMFVDARRKVSSDFLNRYKNLRAKMYFDMAQAFINDQIAIPNDKRLINELSIINLVDPGNMNILQIMSKRDMKRDGIESPNFADALALTYAFSDKQFQKNIDEITAHRRKRQSSVDSKLTWMGV